MDDDRYTESAPKLGLTNHPGDVFQDGSQGGREVGGDRVVMVACRNVARPLFRRWFGLPRATQLDIRRLECEFLATLNSLARVPPEGATNDWQSNAAMLLEEAGRISISRFTQWPSIKHTMFVGKATYVAGELVRLRADRDWGARWRPAIMETPYGAPEFFSRRLYASGNSIHHAHHILTFERITNMRLEDFDVVLEFGGGYGSFARVVRQLGFNGAYVIFDLPHYSALQRLFLSVCGYPVGTGSTDSPPMIGLVSSLADFEIAARSWKRALFVATWSLSESPMEVRNKVAQFLPNCEAMLMAYQSEFSSIDNVTWFNELATHLHGSHRVTTKAIPDLDPKWGRYFIASR